MIFGRAGNFPPKSKVESVGISIRDSANLATYKTARHVRLGHSRDCGLEIGYWKVIVDGPLFEV